MDTSGRLYDDCIRLCSLDAHRETSTLTNELSEESDQFRFLRVSCCLPNLKGSVGLILVKASVILVPSLVLFPTCSVKTVNVGRLF